MGATTETIVPPAALGPAAVAESVSNEKSPGQDAVAAVAGEEEDDFEYPTKMKLVAITVALCLSVFCMALVR